MLRFRKRDNRLRTIVQGRRDVVRLRHAVIAALSIAALARPVRAADIVIGAAGPTSNAEALFGTTWMNGMELAIRNANAAGGVNGQKITLRHEDDGGDPRAVQRWSSATT